MVLYTLESVTAQLYIAHKLKICITIIFMCLNMPVFFSLFSLYKLFYINLNRLIVYFVDYLMLLYFMRLS